MPTKDDLPYCQNNVLLKKREVTVKTKSVEKSNCVTPLLGRKLTLRKQMTSMRKAGLNNSRSSGTLVSKKAASDQELYAQKHSYELDQPVPAVADLKFEIKVELMRKAKAQ